MAFVPFTVMEEYYSIFKFPFKDLRVDKGSLRYITYKYILDLSWQNIFLFFSFNSFRKPPFSQKRKLSQQIALLCISLKELKKKYMEEFT